MKTALILGITGQDGSYLAELLLDKGYAVHGLIRRSSSFNTARIDHLLSDPQSPESRLHLHYGDILDPASIRRVIDLAAPDEVYNLAAQSHVRVSFDEPVYTVETVALGALNVLEAVRSYRDTTGREPRFYQASSSEMFGDSPPPQSESTPFRPRSPYACAKVQAFWQTVNYREAYGLFACNGILFNHESPRRGETFITRKVTRAAARIKLGLQERLYHGNLGTSRDWGYAPEYVDAMWRMLQQSKPDDYVVATGQSRTIAEFVYAVFSWHGLEWPDYCVPDKRYLRPTEVDSLCGDASKAMGMLGWRPLIGFDELVKIMAEADFQLAERELSLTDGKAECIIS